MRQRVCDSQQKAKTDWIPICSRFAPTQKLLNEKEAEVRISLSKGVTTLINSINSISNLIATFYHLNIHYSTNSPINRIYRRTRGRSFAKLIAEQADLFALPPFDIITASRFGLASHKLARHAVTSAPRATELVQGQAQPPRQERVCTAGPSRLPSASGSNRSTQVCHARSSAYSGSRTLDANKNRLTDNGDTDAPYTTKTSSRRSYSSTLTRSKTFARSSQAPSLIDADKGTQPQWWNRTQITSGKAKQADSSMEALDSHIATTQWPFGPSRPEDLYRDAFVAHPDRFDWRKRCCDASKKTILSGSSSSPLQRRRATVSMVSGTESKVAAKARRLAERKMDDRSLRISREQATQLLHRNAEREPLRQAAKVYRDKWTELLDHERTQELSAIAERRKAPIDKLIEEGIAIDGLQGYWQDNSRRHFGKKVAVFKLDAAEPLPRTLFCAGDKVTIMPSAVASSSAKSATPPLLEDDYVIEAEVVERQRNFIRLKFDENDEDIDLVSCPSWRLDYGFNDLTFERIKIALEALEHDVEFIETHYGSRFQYILSGTRLSDVILGIEPPADRVTRGAFWEDARVQSWYDRFSCRDPVIIDGDPLPELNRSQTQAVAMMLRERVSLIQGPPGTGKTRTIVTAIKLLKQDFQVPHPIMLAAHTNVAVDNLADGCIKAGLRVVRIGPSARARAGIDQYTLDAYFLRHPAKARLDQIKRRLDTLDRLKSDYEMGRMSGSASSKVANRLYESVGADGEAVAQSWKDVMAGRKEERDATQSQAGAASVEYEAVKKQLNRLKATYFFLRASIRGEILNHADVICGSAIAAGSPELDMIDLPVVFFDEASMATEPVSLVPLMKGCRHLSIIGDHKQLPPVVTSVEAKQGGLSRSLFERLIESGQNIPSTMLNVQFRMHPSLAEFPNKAFYDGALQNGKGTEQIAPVESSYWRTRTAGQKKSQDAQRLCFIDHQGRESKTDNSTSLYNTSEARIVVDVVVDVLRRNPQLTGDDIGIVTPYAGQQILLEKMLQNERSDARKKASSAIGARSSQLGFIDIHTVDGFEGREKKVILFSTVRTNALGYVGFLADGRRLNVALTRAQSAMFIIGNIDTFKKAQLSEAAYSRVESPNLEALRNYAAYLEQRDAVFSHSKGSLRLSEEVEKEEVVETDAADGGETDPDATDWQHMVAERDTA
ncbi:hypothetical protein NDA14_006412 [Ustilago hordei]|nr:hypothetical protein NDA14_006412 [Ustilago hordei]